jgi:hypothetical protein
MPLLALTNSYCSKLLRYSRGSKKINQQSLTGDFFVREFVFELISIKVEFCDHFVDLLNMSLKAFLRFLNTFVPKHRMESLDILLSYQDIRAKL